MSELKPCMCESGHAELLCRAEYLSDKYRCSNKYCVFHESELTWDAWVAAMIDLPIQEPDTADNKGF